MNCCRSVEPRAAVALVLMSAVLLSAFRRGGAFGSVRLQNDSSLASAIMPALSRNLRRGGSSGTAHLQGVEVGPEGSKVPDVVHRVVSGGELKPEVIVVGDVHGCHDEMLALLERCGYRVGRAEDKERFSVVLVGDLVSKGPKSVEVIRTAREEGFLAVRGNHDNFALAAYTGTGRFAKDPTPRQSGSGGGGVEAPPLPPSWVSHMSREDEEWLEALPYTLRFPSLGCMVVHAGLVPNIPLENQSLEAMTTMRNVKEGDYGFEPLSDTTEGIAWAKAWQGPDHIYFGHDAKRGFQKEAFATGLDTGCVYGRTLTAAILPSGRIVCVPAEAQYVRT